VPQQRSPVVFTTRNVLATAAVFLIVLICFRLGFWQLDRREQRQAFNAVLEQRRALPPITDVEALRDSTQLPYRLARLAGRWDGDRSVVLPGRSHRGAPGVHLLTPLRLDGVAFAVLVNRGWVPAPDGATIDFDWFATDSAAVVEGMVMPFPSVADSRGGTPRPATGQPLPEFRRIWFAIDEAALRDQFPYPLADVQLQALADRDPESAPIPAAAPQLDGGPHLGYAIQWFSFGLIGIIGWGVIVLRGAGTPAGRSSEAYGPQ